ncbi:oxygenase MpaB family protein [Rhodococcus sp. 077-4]|uniref:oxygenase MpaB family protein n=1 Tax=Rhodococcus sp. 077-4 TaxID=2789271 RepID=UPI0039F6205E
MSLTEARYPLTRYWESRRVSGAEVHRMIDALDPVEDDVEITHLSMEVLTPPLFAYMGYASGFARTLGNPATADRTWRNGTGDQILKSAQRDLDTLTFFGEFIRRGHRSPEAQAVFNRVQQIHGQIGRVSNEGQIHVLGMLIFDQERFARYLGHRWFSDRENEARFNFWLGVGNGMRLRDMPQTREDFLAWIDDYEERLFEPSVAATETFEGQLNGISAYVPAPMRRMVRDMLIDSLDPRVRELLGFDKPSLVVTPIVKVGTKTLMAARPVTRYRLDRTWVGNFSRFGEDPSIAKMGYQHKPH